MMREPKHVFRTGPFALYLLVLLAGIVVIVIATGPYGIGTTADSAAFISTANNIVDGRGFRHYGGEPLTLWPPLYPVLLSGFRLAGLDSLAAARFIQAILYGLILGTGIGWILRTVKHPAGRILTSLVLLFSGPLFWVGSHAWSDALFALFFMLFLVLLPRIRQQANLPDTVLLGLCAGAAFSTRYIGLSLCLTGVLFLLLQRADWKHKLRALALFSLLSGTATGLWMLRNLHFHKPLTGPRSSPGRGWLQNTEEALHTLGTWILPESLPQVLLVTAGGAGMLVLLFGVGRIIQRERRNPEPGSPDALMIATGCTVYLLLLGVGASVTLVDPLRHRLLVPVFVPGVLLFGLLFDALLSFDGFRKGFRRKLLVGVVALWVATLGVRFAGLVVGTYREGANPATIGRLKHLQTTGYLEAHHPDALLFSNDPSTIYFLTRQEAHWLPPANAALTIHPKHIRTRDILAVWLKHAPPGPHHTPRTLSHQENLRLEPIAEFEDGLIFRVVHPGRAKSPPAEAPTPSHALSPAHQPSTER